MWNYQLRMDLDAFFISKIILKESFTTFSKMILAPSIGIFITLSAAPSLIFLRHFLKLNVWKKTWKFKSKQTKCVKYRKIHRAKRRFNESRNDAETALKRAEILPYCRLNLHNHHRLYMGLQNDIITSYEADIRVKLSSLTRPLCSIHAWAKE